MLIIASYSTAVAWLRLRAGEWDEAERATHREIESGIVVRLLAKTVLTELAVRRGDPDADERLTEIAGEAERTGELQRIVPALELAAEWALTTGAPMPIERFETLAPRSGRARGSPAGSRSGSQGGRLWPGSTWSSTSRSSGPHGAMLRHDWRGAADGFGEVGWTYDRALMLSLLDDEEALVESLEIARGSGPSR